MFRKVLIANRGEIAVRVIRACRELGIGTVAVHSDVDTEALHTRLADEAVCIGPAAAKQSYLHIPALIAAAEISGADAIHPGYGFLSENASFASLCRDVGLTFIGPSPENMGQWGDKVSARRLAKSLGLPLMEGSEVIRDTEDAVAKARAVGFPVMLKASGGGGGRGMKIIRSAAEMEASFQQAQQEAIAGFQNGDLYVERYVEEPRHIEFQVIADGKGDVRVLGERECSIQRRHQKLLEEAPSVAVSDELRRDMAATIRRALADSNYVSAGTLEFLMTENGELAFMEMNTRIQVEHPVTELVTGVDLIAEQIRIAAGLPMEFPNREIKPRGWAIECRVNAEDPVTFAPWPGLITEYHPPGGAGVRVDSGVYGGWRVPSAYDSLLAKVITYGRTREEARVRMLRALGETLIGGIRTNIPLHMRILAHDDFRTGKLSTRFLERM
ncbi:MAG: acetyl-CoA carboxylase biotin carboxylase subunit [Sandaracinaceae bacterium]|nr:acetyl-CoA carboxylase biotin carboxylase subunit [Sandaracinaceae bacterium]MBK7772733.1 acetyl-CoA carboxylase biotin carboxylase subunit [Sandaracinaceae bacterium]MBK8406938.1 acetyl-CoA carboxylase biotin carboxylase subunit [Sandaracinaceae bacterium]MBK8593219.1 acetyl-CoA carboxylase biotin carboxylase subunit [Sandaracinaceae bacterium]